MFQRKDIEPAHAECAGKHGGLASNRRPFVARRIYKGNRVGREREGEQGGGGERGGGWMYTKGRECSGLGNPEYFVRGEGGWKEVGGGGGEKTVKSQCNLSGGVSLQKRAREREGCLSYQKTPSVHKSEGRMRMCGDATRGGGSQVYSRNREGGGGRDGKIEAGLKAALGIA